MHVHAKMHVMTSKTHAICLYMHKFLHKVRPVTGLYLTKFTDRLSTGLPHACHYLQASHRPATCLLQACQACHKPATSLYRPAACLYQAYHRLIFYKGSTTRIEQGSDVTPIELHRAFPVHVVVDCLW